MNRFTNYLEQKQEEFYKLGEEFERTKKDLERKSDSYHKLVAKINVLSKNFETLKSMSDEELRSYNRNNYRGWYSLDYRKDQVYITLDKLRYDARHYFKERAIDNPLRIIETSIPIGFMIINDHDENSPYIARISEDGYKKIRKAMEKIEERKMKEKEYNLIAENQINDFKTATELDNLENLARYFGMERVYYDSRAEEARVLLKLAEREFAAEQAEEQAKLAKKSSA